MSNSPTAALTVSLKGKDQSQPWLVINAENPLQLEQQLKFVIEQPLADLVAQAQARFHLALGGVKAEPASTGDGWGGASDRDVDVTPQQAQSQSYARPKPAPQGGGGGQYPDRVYLDIPFSAAADRQRAKGLGARFDGERKQWYSTPKFAGEHHEALVAEFG